MLRNDDPRFCRSCGHGLSGELAKRADGAPIKTCGQCRDHAKRCLETQEGKCFACKSPLMDGSMAAVCLMREGPGLMDERHLIHQQCSERYWTLRYEETMATARNLGRFINRGR